MKLSDHRQEFVERISHHAYDRHVDPESENNAQKENQFEDLGISTREDIEAHISSVLAKDDVLVQSGCNDRACVYDADTNTVVIINPNTGDRGTSFRPDAEEEYIDSFRNTERKAGLTLDVRANGLADYDTELSKAKAAQDEVNKTLKEMDSFLADTRSDQDGKSEAAEKKEKDQDDEFSR